MTTFDPRLALDRGVLRPDRLALDRASTRSVDRDGRLRVNDNVFTSVGISEYMGREVPDAERLGLRPDGVYKLFRPENELKRAAPSFAGLPILLEHRPISAMDHPAKDVAGAVMNDVVFDGKTVRGSIMVWTRDAITAIENGSDRGLSCGYYYTSIMKSGTWQGEDYDGIMSGI